MRLEEKEVLGLIYVGVIYVLVKRLVIRVKMLTISKGKEMRNIG